MTTAQSKKLTGNGFWESSRIILPEHRASLISQRRETFAKEKPILDGDELDIIYRKITESFTNKTEITLILFDRFEDTRAIGVIERVDTFGRRVRMDGEWFPVENITAIE